MSCESGSCKDCATIQGAIAYFKGRRDGDWNDPCQGALNTYLGMAIDALEKQAEPENKPLTLEQLREMDGEPVWTVPLDGTGCGEWTIIAIGAQIEMLKALSPDTAYEECNYGKTWLAYARKPEK